MNIEEKIESVAKLGREVEIISAQFSGKFLRPQTLRLRLALASFHVCRQHAAAIALLASEKKYDSSARALLRPTIESSLRSEWLLVSSRQSELLQIAQHHKGKIFPGLGYLAKHLDTLFDHDFRVYALDLDADHANSFTHGGSETLGRHILGNYGLIGWTHDDEECATVVHKATVWVANAGITLAHRLRCYEEAEMYRYVINKRAS